MSEAATATPPAETDKGNGLFEQEPNGTVNLTIPLVITKDMKQQLADLGYSPADRREMTPAQALEIINKKKPRISPEEKAKAEQERKEALTRNAAKTNLKNLKRFVESTEELTDEKIWQTFIRNEKYRKMAGFDDLKETREPVALNRKNLLVYMDRPDAFFLSDRIEQPSQQQEQSKPNEQDLNNPQPVSQQQQPEVKQQPQKIQPTKKQLQTRHQLWHKLKIK